MIISHVREIKAILIRLQRKYQKIKNKKKKEKKINQKKS